ncbi:MATE family efflux transporter [Clostridium estertheticum]|uniref:Multidrug export protein MepA n=1 Tax=Clostridium estertheticum subsp. estertheticum TaxID=1552 RepID=A0A1J0GG73_9CLOT|nr:MATE family efflux transporter [Clostridium estertheticum]APC40370.1 MATE family efflux transporter [Clostridium estertheticum subsp. estertheticum]MBU3075559.1 MATE family efflux transporter [Clostridium estertheticum]MBU3165611.1 MATE family efflux transporter [Clostridium estertheticum]MBZ9617814.1 MATE family efflux transporter [Clostridium estertheticum subsp. laramiense]WAG73481.1 MATE family efflux transporter [Clostridium estertheticum]
MNGKLGSESISKLLFKFSVPAITGMVVNALYNIVDRIYIGHIKGVGSYALSGLAITFPISVIIMAFGMLIGIGACSVISIRLGEKNVKAADNILGNAVMLLTIISVALGIFGVLFLNKILMLFGADQNNLPYAKAYIQIILMGSVFQNIGFGINNIIRAEGNPKMAMLTMMFGAIINIILDPIFIFVFKMGIQGAAIATVFSQVFNTLLVLRYFTAKNSGSILKLKKINLKLNKYIVNDIFAIGVAPFSMQIASSLVAILYNKGLYTYGGNLAIAAMGILNSISMLIFMPIVGISQGIQPIIGYNYGAKLYDRVFKILKLAIIFGTCIAVIGFIVVQLFANQLITIFVGNNPELIKLGAHGLRIDLMVLPILGFQILGASYFQAINEAKTSMVLSVLRQVIVLIPIILILPLFLKLDGLWFSQPCADLIATSLTAFFLVRSIKKLRSSSVL